MSKSELKGGSCPEKGASQSFHLSQLIHPEKGGPLSNKRLGGMCRGRVSTTLLIENCYSWNRPKRNERGDSQISQRRSAYVYHIKTGITRLEKGIRCKGDSGNRYLAIRSRSNSVKGTEIKESKGVGEGNGKRPPAAPFIKKKCRGDVRGEGGETGWGSEPGSLTEIGSGPLKNTRAPERKRESG